MENVTSHEFVGRFAQSCRRCGLPESEHGPVVAIEEPPQTEVGDRSWTTGNEKDWLDGLGSHSNSVDASRLILLERYITAIQRRQDIGQLDRGALVNYAGKALERERQLIT